MTTTRSAVVLVLLLAGAVWAGDLGSAGGEEYVSDTAIAWCVIDDNFHDSCGPLIPLPLDRFTDSLVQQQFADNPKARPKIDTIRIGTWRYKSIVELQPMAVLPNKQRMAVGKCILMEVVPGKYLPILWFVPKQWVWTSIDTSHIYSVDNGEVLVTRNVISGSGGYREDYELVWPDSVERPHSVDYSSLIVCMRGVLPDSLVVTRYIHVNWKTMYVTATIGKKGEPDKWAYSGTAWCQARLDGRYLKCDKCEFDSLVH